MATTHVFNFDNIGLITSIVTTRTGTDLAHPRKDDKVMFVIAAGGENYNRVLVTKTSNSAVSTRALFGGPVIMTLGEEHKIAHKVETEEVVFSFMPIKWSHGMSDAEAEAAAAVVAAAVAEAAAAGVRSPPDTGTIGVGS